MAAVVECIEIARRPADVFAYVADAAHLPEWQESVVSVRRQDERSVAVGSRFVVTRRVGRRAMPMTMEVSELDPPGRWGVRGVDGPVRGIVEGTVEPLAGGERSRVTLALAFEGHGSGKLLVPLVVRRQARSELPRSGQTLKEVLERGV